MSRAKYSPEARNAIMATFVRAARDILATEGLDAVSIRRVSSAAGYSSAALYLYFEDMGELVTMSLISSLSSYASDIVGSMPAAEDPLEGYLRTWRILCTHAFANPSAFLSLFFGPRSDRMHAIAKKYYELFPEEAGQIGEELLEMLTDGSLAARNLAVLGTFAQELGLTEEEASLANDLIVASFRSFLLNAQDGDQTLSRDEVEGLADHFVRCVLFVLRATGE